MKIGKTILDLFCTINKDLHKFTKPFMNDNSSYKISYHMGEESSILLDNIFECLLNDDRKRFESLCQEHFSITHKKTIDIVRTIFLHILADLYKHNNIVSLKIKKHAEKLFYNTNKNY